MDLRESQYRHVTIELTGDIQNVEELVPCVSRLEKERVPRKGQTVMHVACGQGDVDAAVLLLANGYSETATDADGNTPLHYAVKVGLSPHFVPMPNHYFQNQHADIVRLLLCLGADHRKRNFVGDSALDIDSS